MHVSMCVCSRTAHVVSGRLRLLKGALPGPVVGVLVGTFLG